MERIKNYLIHLLGGFTAAEIAARQSAGFNRGREIGAANAKIHYRVLPLPFTAEQLRGGSYGEFITPVGFATPFGECNIPAPGQHGYEQRAYYVDKAALNSITVTGDLLCQHANKFADPANSEHLVPVIVTVLR